MICKLLALTLGALISDLMKAATQAWLLNGRKKALQD